MVHSVRRYSDPKFQYCDVSPESLIVGQLNWCQNAQKSRFSITYPREVEGLFA